MKKFINEPNDVVEEMLRGIALANPNVVHSEGLGVISRKEKTRKVGLVSGGGSGHEPAHAGYVGRGMLDAAVAGNVFSSPDPMRILEGIRQADGGKGVLLVIKNYSGDCMNFKMAKTMAEFEDIDVDYVIVKDDVAIADEEGSTGRRGIAGTVFVHKIAGALAEEGANLAQVKAVAEKVVRNVRTMGVSFTGCTIPAAGKPGFVLGDTQMEVGMGIHGERSYKTCDILPSKEIAKVLVDHIVDDYAKKGIGVSEGEFALMVNGLGSTPLMELYILNADVRAYLDQLGVNVCRTFVGNYMTALEMAGASVTLLKLDDEMRRLLDAPSEAPGMFVPGTAKPLPKKTSPVVRDGSVLLNSADYVEFLKKAYAKIHAEGEYITELDATVADGDHWVNMDSGFGALVEQADELASLEPADLFMQIGKTMMFVIGGSSGVLYGNAYMNAAKGLRGKAAIGMVDLCNVLDDMLAGIEDIGEGKPGMCTMIDALDPAVRAFKEGLENGLDDAVLLATVKAAAVAGAQATKDMPCNRGRASYLDNRGVGFLDPGAVTMSYQVEALMDHVIGLLGA